MLHFATFEIDVDSFELRSDGVRIDVEPQVLAVILHLARHQDRMVRKEELLDEIWGDRFVSESALTSRIKSARRALGDDGRTQSMIRTVHGRGYQFVPHVTDSEVALTDRDDGGHTDGADLDAARSAFDVADWHEARARFSVIGADQLEPVDLERWAEAAWWNSDLVECIGVRQAAFQRYDAIDDDVSAARVAIALADDYRQRGASTVHRVWMQRAAELLTGFPDASETGQLLRSRVEDHLESGDDLAAALSINEAMCELADRLGDADLMAQGLQDRGRCLVALGQVDDGMRLIDDAMLLAATSDVSAGVTGRLYCNMLSACVGLGHYGRAQDWSDEAVTWCAGHDPSPFPGICQVHRVGLRRRMGDLEHAVGLLESIASNSSFSNVVAGALIELGEVHLRRGRIVDAEAAFLQAHAHGADATAGLAQVAIEQERPRDAIDLLQETLNSRADHHITRARLLPILTDAAVIADDVETATRAADELAAVATHCAGAYCGSAAQARGTVALMTGRHDDAGDAFRLAMKFYGEVPLPIEMATVRLGLAVVATAVGSAAFAGVERSTAMSTFEAAGATPVGIAHTWLRLLDEAK